MIGSSDVVRYIIVMGEIVTKYHITIFDVVQKYGMDKFPNRFLGIDSLIGGMFDLSYRGFSIHSFRLANGPYGPLLRVYIDKDSISTNIDENVIEALSTRFKL